MYFVVKDVRLVRVRLDGLRANTVGRAIKFWFIILDKVVLDFLVPNKGRWKIRKEKKTDGVRK